MECKLILCQMSSTCQIFILTLLEFILNIVTLRSCCLCRNLTGASLRWLSLHTVNFCYWKQCNPATSCWNTTKTEIHTYMRLFFKFYSLVLLCCYRVIFLQEKWFKLYILWIFRSTLSLTYKILDYANLVRLKTKSNNSLC